MEKINLKNCLLSEIEDFFIQMGEKKFRAKQVFSWIYKGVSSFDEMTDISKGMRDLLKEKTFIEEIRVEQILNSEKDGTRKYLFLLKDGQAIESVFMRYKYGNSVCISSQAGCKMGCAFCASAIGGSERNLSASEMINQVLQIQKDVSERIGNIVVMGSGEPFENYNQLLKFIQIINDKEGLNIGLRNITVSTCGIVPKIIDFAKDMPQVTLAVSLHAPNDKIRNALMPINKKYPFEVLLSSCREYVRISNKRITFEYALIQGVNDSLECAYELAKQLRGIICHVNLIPLNTVSERKHKGSDRKTAEQFKVILEKANIETTIRRELGSDINAACGQLRKKYFDKNNE